MNNKQTQFQKENKKHLETIEQRKTSKHLEKQFETAKQTKKCQQLL